eukprot:scaffold15734_cov171-Skeletonema_marinoi.AAC.3
MMDCMLDCTAGECGLCPIGMLLYDPKGVRTRKQDVACACCIDLGTLTAAIPLIYSSIAAGCRGAALTAASSSSLFFHLNSKT